MHPDQYAATLAEIQRPLRNALEALEEVQQSILFQDIAAAQRQLADRCGDSLERVFDALARCTPPVAQCELHAALRAAAESLLQATTRFSTEAPWGQFAHAFLAARELQCRALERLYRWRTELPGIAPYFRLAGAAAPAPTRTAPGVPVGVLHGESTATHHAYALYVPEYYDPQQAWPLIVALHGGYGSGTEYLWSWLRAAASRGYLVLAPSATGPTWSILQPEIDRRSILGMLDEVAARYAVDRARIYLTGLSDGGTFSYLLGLQDHARFAALAPIAGVLSPQTDPLLRARAGLELPIHVVHGVHDAIFPVQTVRSTNRLLESLGYALTYTELPAWGHALTSRINEQLVLPWFESLHTR